MAASSLILSLASLLSSRCETVFVQSALLFHRSHHIVLTSKEETRMLGDFAVAACRTSNPDILWKIGATESGLRPMITRSNTTKIVSIGRAAQLATARAMIDKSENNIDVGILQINIKAHGRRMVSLGLYPLNPYSQVSYIVDHMMPELTTRCGNFAWVGCYHSWSSVKLAHSYQSLVGGQDKALVKSLSELVQIRHVASENLKK